MAAKGAPKGAKSAGKADAPKAAAAKASKPAAKTEAKAAPPAPPSVPEAAPSRPVPAAPASQAQQAEALAKRTFRRKLVGRVTSDKMNKTVVVEVVRRTLDSVYKKYVKSRARYKAHDEKNEYKVGDRVEITEHRPISREKTWTVTKLIERPELE